MYSDIILKVALQNYGFWLNWSLTVVVLEFVLKNLVTSVREVSQITEYFVLFKSVEKVDFISVSHMVNQTNYQTNIFLFFSWVVVILPVWRINSKVLRHKLLTIYVSLDAKVVAIVVNFNVHNEKLLATGFLLVFQSTLKTFISYYCNYL